MDMSISGYSFSKYAAEEVEFSALALCKGRG